MSPIFWSLPLRILLCLVQVWFRILGTLLIKDEMIQFEDFHLLKHFTCDIAHLADNGGILKSLEIEYNEIIDLALWTPAAQYKPLLTKTWEQRELILFDPNKGAK